ALVSHSLHPPPVYITPCCAHHPLPPAACFSFQCSRDPRDLHSFPTRRSSDLPATPSSFVRMLRDRSLRLRALQHRGVRRRSDRRSEEHTSELQSPDHLVCRLLLEKKKKRREIPCDKLE